MTNEVLLVWVPSRRGKGASKSFPVGLLYVSRIFEDLGFDVKIFDVYKHAFNKKDEDPFCIQKLIDKIREEEPQIIGFGGIATSYGWTKILSNEIKKNFPDIMQIAGGALSSTYDLLLTKTDIDVVFHGEVELTLPEFIERFKGKDDFRDIQGISYYFDEKVIKNPPAEQIKNMDEIPFPAYHVVDMEDYFSKDDSFSEKFLKHQGEILKTYGIYDKVKSKLEGVNVLFPIVTARGCTHRCSFCYRHMKLYRKHSVNYIIKHIKYVQEKFGVKGLNFYDELFSGNMKWVFEFCDALKENNLKIAYKTSARADQVSEDMLERMSETGCFNIEYGQESGSDKILKEYRKGMTKDQNLKSFKMTINNGIFSVIQLVIGSPGETKKTINETVDFLKQANVETYSLNYLLPFPGAPIWEYVEENNCIDNVEEYLDIVAEKGGGPIINLTSMGEKEWRSSSDRIRYKISFNNIKNKDDFVAGSKQFAKYIVKRSLPQGAIETLKVLLNTIARIKK